MKIFTVYRIKNIINGKVYIGYTGKEATDYTSRHFKNALAGKDPNKYLYKAIRKYGPSSFTVDYLVCTLDKMHAQELERHFIDEENSHAITGHGYNFTKGGDGGDTSESPIYKAGIARRDLTGENNGNWGGFSDAHRAAISASKKGKRSVNHNAWVYSDVGKIYLHHIDLNQEKRVKPEMLDAYKQQGYIVGRLKLTCKACGVKADISNMKRHHKHHFQESIDGLH